VVQGDGRGRGLGIPTANLELWAERAIPKAGVYACRAQVGNETWGAVTNVGVRPTFEDKPVPPRVEAHLLDFNRDLYTQEMQLDFIAHLRDETRFPNVQALIDQIHADIEQARKILAKETQKPSKRPKRKELAPKK
jgi:riboflavin kinase / FMN adenylyltransferase